MSDCQTCRWYDLGEVLDKCNTCCHGNSQYQESEQAETYRLENEHATMLALLKELAEDACEKCHRDGCLKPDGCTDCWALDYQLKNVKEIE